MSNRKYLNNNDVTYVLVFRLFDLRVPPKLYTAHIIYYYCSFFSSYYLSIFFFLYNFVVLLYTLYQLPQLK